MRGGHYRPRSWVLILLVVGNLAWGFWFLVGGLLCSVLATAGVWASATSESWLSWGAQAVPTAVLALLTFGFLVALGHVLYRVFGLRHMWLKTSDSGLEFRYRSLWFRCAWTDVQGVGKRGPFGLPVLATDVLWLHRVEFLGRVRRLPRSYRPCIPLWGMQGWPQGALANDLARAGFNPQLKVTPSS